MARGSVASLLVALLLTACASGGRAFHAERLAELQPGRTTLPEAVEILGEPEQVIAGDRGAVVAHWLHVRSSAWSGRTEIQQVAVRFGAGGRMDRVLRLQGVPIAEADRNRLQPARAD